MTMRNALTIAGKELSSYFVQPVAYVVLTVFVLLAGWFFFALLKQFSEMVQVTRRCRTRRRWSISTSTPG